MQFQSGGLMFEILSICNGGGYRYCRTNPPHPKRNKMGLYPLHRVLMENKIGRILEKWEVIHHKDEDKTNDDIENLELLSNSYHGKLHHPFIDKVRFICPCGTEFYLRPNIARRRTKVAKNPLCCSHSCSGKYSRVEK